MFSIKQRSQNSVVEALLLTLSLCLLHNFATSLPNQIKVGAIFGPDELQQELVFKAALDDVNSNADLGLKTVFMPKVENITSDDSFHADRKACNLLKTGVVAILGPMTGAASQHVQAICDSLEVPHIEIKPDLILRRYDLAINLYPSYDVLTRAYIDLIQAWNWTSFAVVYDSSDAMIRLQDIFKELSGLYAKKWTIKLFQLQAGSSFRDLFWSVKRSGENNIVLDVSRGRLFDCLKQAQQVGLMTEKQSYLITSLDLPTINLEDFRYGHTKITSLQLVDRKSKALEKIVQSLNRDSHLANLLNERNLSSTDILIETALIYDAITLLASGVRELDSGQSIETQSLSCDDTSETWQHGSSMINYMRSMSFDGLTGRVNFNQNGRRSGVSFDVIALSELGLEHIGSWQENSGLDIDPVKFNRFYVSETDTVDTLTVTAMRTQPYFMLKSTPSKQEGNDQYEGYAVDLIHELSRLVGFKYRFKEVSDAKYGVPLSTNQNGTPHWNGMIGEILSGKADLAIADLTITSSREQAVDFTLPFMNTGISIVFKKPTNKVTTLFSFLSPFSLDVWVYVLCAYSGVSVILFVVGHISPYEWTNPYPCRQEEQAVMKNSFSLLNSFWFTIGSLMQQGSDLAPKSMSTRAMAGTWYFFTLIMISSYTANLAAFLTVEKVVYPIESAKDLSEQTEIKYGCIGSGSTYTFFKDSQIETYKKIYKFMMTYNTFVSSNDEGKERVEQGNFAFFMESTSIEYITERNCNLTQIGSPLDSKNYGIATRKWPPYKRPYRMLLSQAILQLQENGMLHMLKNRWWKERHGVGSCSDDNKGGGVTELSLANVGGVFVVLLGGMGLAFILALFESFLWLMRRKLGRDPMCEQMMQDLKFALSCQSSTKPARRRVPLDDDT